MEHYLEGLQADYQVTVRQHNTLVASMDEALRVEDDLSMSNRSILKHREKRKWEGSFDSSKKKKNLAAKKNDKSSSCGKCHSSDKGPYSSSTISCRRCGKLGHREVDCKSTKPICYYYSKRGI